MSSVPQPPCSDGTSDYAKALRDFKLNWMKCVHTYVHVAFVCKVYHFKCARSILNSEDLHYHLYAILSCRAGCIQPDELEAQFGEEIDFLAAKLKFLEGKSEVPVG